MRLTNTIRDAFVRAAMQDVPRENFEEEAHKIAIADSIEQLPAQLRPMALDKNLSTYFNLKSFWFYDSPFSSVMVFAQRGHDYRPSKDAEAKLNALTAKANEQKATRVKLKDSLHAAAYSVTTRKALVALLPEFEKYLPADEPTACRTVPAIANLVADFTKAGWPKAKGEQNQQTKVAA